jgi:hypothetical protein
VKNKILFLARLGSGVGLADKEDVHAAPRRPAAPDVGQVALQGDGVGPHAQLTGVEHVPVVPRVRVPDTSAPVRVQMVGQTFLQLGGEKGEKEQRGTKETMKISREGDGTVVEDAVDLQVEICAAPGMSTGNRGLRCLADHVARDPHHGVGGRLRERLRQQNSRGTGVDCARSGVKHRPEAHSGGVVEDKDLHGTPRRAAAKHGRVSGDAVRVGARGHRAQMVHRHVLPLHAAGVAEGPVLDHTVLHEVHVGTPSHVPDVVP